MIPPLPPARGPGQDGGTASIAPRYEDITQDGRFHLSALMPGVGAAVWRGLLAKLPATEYLLQRGILPILSRLVLIGEDRSVSVNVPVRYEGSFRFAREKNGDRLFANMWVEARAPIASTLSGDPPADAPYEVVGRVFAEHVITRPFAPPAERRVTRLEAPGVPAIPEDEHVFDDAEALLAGASAGDPLDDAGEHAFGMMHTDSNQHVNSLVYPRVFEELAMRKLLHNARVPAPHQLLARVIELRFRRPFFAGERASIGLRFTDGTPGGGDAPPSKIGVVGGFFQAGAGVAGKPSCSVRMLFR